MQRIMKALAATFVALLLHAAPAYAQEEAVATPPAAEARAPQPVLSIQVEGSQRVEADTILSYSLIRPGEVPDSRLINLSI